MGYSVPPLIKDENLESIFTNAVEKGTKRLRKISKIDIDVAEYSTCLAHNTKYIVNTNLRAVFWEAELRTISQGHFDYRKLEQQIAKLVIKHYPLLSKYLMVDFNNYLMARRGSTDNILKREQELKMP